MKSQPPVEWVNEDLTPVEVLKNGVWEPFRSGVTIIFGEEDGET